MQLSELIIDAKGIIGPATEVDDTTLTSWINDACNYIYSAISDRVPDYYSRVARTSSIALQSDYLLPSDFATMLEVYVDDERYTPPTFYPLDYNYQLRGNVCVLDPIPQTTGTKNIKLVYEYIPPELVATTDSPDLPMVFQRIIKHYVKANYLSQDAQGSGEETSSSNKFVFFNQMLDKLLDKLEQRQERQQYVEVT